MSCHNNKYLLNTAAIILKWSHNEPIGLVQMTIAGWSVLPCRIRHKTFSCLVALYISIRIIKCNINITMITFFMIWVMIRTIGLMYQLVIAFDSIYDIKPWEFIVHGTTTTPSISMTVIYHSVVLGGTRELDIYNRFTWIKVAGCVSIATIIYHKKIKKWYKRKQILDAIL